MRSAVLIGVLLSALGGFFPPGARRRAPAEARARVAGVPSRHAAGFRDGGRVPPDPRRSARQPPRLSTASYLDTARFADAAYRDSAIEYLRARYESLRIDVVIATTTATLELVRIGRRRDVRQRRGRVPRRDLAVGRCPDHGCGVATRPRPDATGGAARASGSYPRRSRRRIRTVRPDLPPTDPAAIRRHRPARDHHVAHRFAGGGSRGGNSRLACQRTA